MISNKIDMSDNHYHITEQKRMTQYKVISATLYKIQDKVQEALRDGWAVSGGVCIGGNGFDAPLCYQAMVKE